ncbi:unnamed protein product [Rhodiola kirilowii]
MVLHVPQKIESLWNEWNLRTVILCSLMLQIILIFVASWRKRTGNVIITALIWSAYLLADWFAAFAVGLIANGLSQCEKEAQATEILSFWAPFLLLHLGGPDNITAFSLEDNELWIRHLLGLVIQVVAVAYVLSQTLPNELTIPTLLMFLSGTIKYSERTRALYKACLGNFKNSMLPKADPGPNYAQLMEELSGKQNAGVPVDIKTPDVSTFTGKHITGVSAVSKTANEAKTSGGTISLPNLLELDDTEIVQYGHKFFLTFKGLIVDLMLSFRERNESRGFFLTRTVKEVFGVMEVELNLMYDVLYTKIGIVNDLSGYILRSVSSGCIIVSLVLYHLHVITLHGKHHKQSLTRPSSTNQPQTTKEFDNCVSYILIAGALALDAIALFKIILSDWTVMKLQNATARSVVSTVQSYITLDRHWRWSKRIQTHNLIAYCLHKRIKLVEKAANCIGVQEVLDELLYAASVSFDDELRNFIFSELKTKAEKGEDIDKANEIYNGRGDWVLSEAGLPELIRSVDVEYDESLLLWHVATELCEQDEDNPSGISHQATTDVEAPSSAQVADMSKYRRFCKVLSEYMLYLLVMKPRMMSAVSGIGQIRYQDTCEELKRFVKRDHKEQNNIKDMHREACNRLLLINTKVEPSYVKGDKSKSVLFDACILAKKLIDLKREKRWKIMSQVWVEIMAYAASHCRANTHAQEISKGGQLLCFVWLLMAHFGLGEQFRIKSGNARAKLIVAK